MSKVYVNVAWHDHDYGVVGVYDDPVEALRGASAHYKKCETALLPLGVFPDSTKGWETAIEQFQEGDNS